MTPLAAIDSALARFGWRLFAQRLVRCLLVAAAVHGVLVLIVAGLDRFLFLEDGVRRGLAAVAVGLPLVLLAGLVAWLVATRPDRRQLAYRFEAASGLDLAETVVTAEAMARATRGGEPQGTTHDRLVAELVSAASNEAARAAGRARPRDRWLVPAAVGAALVAALWGLLAAWPACEFPLMLARTYTPWRDLPKPSFVRISVVPETIRIGRGEELVVQAEIGGGMPWLVERLLRLSGNDTRRCLLEIVGQPREEMTRVHRRLFLATRPDVSEPLEFFVCCGDARTGPHTVEVVAQPAVAELGLTITPPAYTGRPVERRTSAGEPLRLLVGSQVAVEFRADQELERAEVTAAGKPVPDVTWDAATRTGEFALEVVESQEFAIDLVNRQGFHAVRPTLLTIEAVIDQKPIVQLELPAAESEQVPQALVPVRATVEDDLAIASAVLLWQLNPQLDAEAPLRELPLELPAVNQAALALAAAFDLEATGAVPGDEIVGFVRARDSAGNDGESPPFTIRVVSFTRGQNERERLAVLTWLATAAPAVIAAGTNPLPADVATQLADEATRLALRPVPDATPAGLGSLLEREAYLAETAAAKQDAIALHGLLTAGRAVPAETIQALAGRRRLENVIVRLYGMRTEAGRLRAALGQEGDAEAVSRRATLGLRTLEEIGGDLLELARSLPAAGLDPQNLEALQAALNETGYRMTRGSAPKRAAACGRLTDGITELIAALVPAFPGLARLEAETRGQVGAAVEGLVTEAARSPDDAARQWCLRRLELLDLDPWTAGADMLVALAGAAATPPLALDAAVVAAERGWWQWLSAEWQRQQLAAVPELADDERAVLAELLAARLPAAPPPRPFQELIGSVATAAVGVPGVTAPPAAAKSINASIDQLLASAPTDPLARREAVARFDRAATLAVMAAAARGRIVQLASGGSFADDAFLLRLRDAIYRYRQNARLATADPDAEGWRRPLAGLQAAVTKLVAAAAAGELTAPEAVERSPFLAAARQSRLLRDAAIGGDRRLLEQGWPEAADLVLADHVSQLDDVVAALDAADRLLAADPPHEPEWLRLRGLADRGLAEFAAVAAGAEDLAESIAETRGKLAALDRPTGWDATATRARRLALGELRPAVAALARRVAAVGERADADPGGFEGGPAAVWEAESRRDAIVGRRAVVDAWQAARRRCAAAVLDAVEEPAAVSDEALPWAAFALRLGLSELGGAARGGGPRRQAETKGDPLVAWLRREIDAARKAVRSRDGQVVYRDATLEYLDAVDDLLRYDTPRARANP
jgi:hypothetical protein